MEDDKIPLNEPLNLPGDDRRVKKPSFKKRRPGRFFKKFLVGILVVVVLAGLGYGGWKLFGSKGDKPTQAKNTDQPVKEKSANVSGDLPEAQNSETFKSDVLRIEFMHPRTWKSTENEGAVRVESPEFTYKSASKGDVPGNFRIYIRKGAREVDSKYIGRGVAVLSSEKLKYSQPEPGQRSETFLSAFGLDTTDNFAFFLIAGNFELNKNDTLGPTYGKEPDTVIIAGGYSAKNLAEDLATNTMPIDKFNQTNAYKQAIEIIKSLKIK